MASSPATEIVKNNGLQLAAETAALRLAVYRQPLREEKWKT